MHLESFKLTLRVHSKLAISCSRHVWPGLKHSPDARERRSKRRYVWVYTRHWHWQLPVMTRNDVAAS